MRNQSFRQQLNKLQLNLTVIVLSVSWVFVFFGDYLIFRDLSVKKFESTVKILSRNLTACLTFKDADECKRVLRSLSQEGDIRNAWVVDASGRLFSQYARGSDFLMDFVELPHKGGYQYRIENDMIVSVYPIMENGHEEGQLYLTAEFNMIETFGKRHALAFLVVMIGGLLFARYLSGYLQRKISGQVNLLLNAMNRIRKDQSYNLRIAGEGSWNEVEVQEFRQLGEAFDGMIEQIETRDISMKVQNENLEKIIEEKVQDNLRTAELASLGEMAAGIAHEINNPLTIIVSTNRVMLRQLENDRFDRDNFIELLKDVDTTVARIAKIVTGLRNISRKAMDGDIDECTFDDVFTDVLEVAESKFKSKGIEIRKSYPQEQALKKFKANRIQLSQVLVNLLNNSCDAIIESSGDPWVDLRIFVEKNKIRLKVIDSGNGIPLKVREKMFNPFFTTKEIGKGTGIGLSMSKSMVEKMGGNFYYDENSKNTCFVIEFAC